MDNPRVPESLTGRKRGVFGLDFHRRGQTEFDPGGVVGAHFRLPFMKLLE
ncbi:hypothetical protein OPIT5_16045 [Opitutaceae bacterium TAV5]|nr:hypothetical protein OPIT5_16045 [Opitutaceae bacterium TAV5]